MTVHPQDFLALGRFAARRADDKKALDIRLWDMRRFSSVADYFLLASVESSTQLRAVQYHVADKISEELGLSPLRRDGQGSDQWTVLDYGGLVVHLMKVAARTFYNLERLWENAKEVRWETPSRLAESAEKKSPVRSKKVTRVKIERLSKTKRPRSEKAPARRPARKKKK